MGGGGGLAESGNRLREEGVIKILREEDIPVLFDGAVSSVRRFSDFFFLCGWIHSERAENDMVTLKPASVSRRRLCQCLVRTWGLVCRDSSALTSASAPCVLCSNVRVF